MIDILKLQKEVIGQYKSYVSSFLQVKDERIRNFCQNILDKGELWPDPILQCSPGFQRGESVKELIQSGVFHPEMNNIFNGFELYKHQAEAIKLGTQKKGFIVTSGTGSGKSLTYLGSIFNKVLNLKKEQGKGVKAIVVYPMNALVNSQEGEIRKYAQSYKKKTGKEFPIKYGKYTGQEKQKEKQQILEDPPHILLTNYMMLELLLTRTKESELRDSIFQHLEFLVFDELHTYRGRQGADVAMLIRRIKAGVAPQNQLICMGTSATLSSGTLHQQKKDVAELGRQLFDETFEKEQIIMESLKQTLVKAPTAVMLKVSLQTPIDFTEGTEKFLLEHPLAYWMEKNIALKKQDDDWVRGTPRTIEEISKTLAAETEISERDCKKRLDELLKLLQKVNQQREDQILPFRVHQFIAQTGNVKVTLESPEDRHITNEDIHKYEKNGEKLELFQVLFNRQSGLPYIKVCKQNNQLLPWDGELEEADPTEGEYGYLLMENEEVQDLWDETEEEEKLPESWIERKKSGVSIKKEKKKRLPRKVFFNKYGHCSSEEEEGKQKGWFVAAPLLLDPLSGIIYNGSVLEFNKLIQLGESGRSISTTVLSLGVLQKLEEQEAPKEIRKVMSFTDNRQDAALQSGHFNDFVSEVFLRASIYKALQREGALDTSTIAPKVFKYMNLKQEEYAQTASDKAGQIRKNEVALKKWLWLKIVFDLRRSWRNKLPNLEQTGWLKVEYKFLREEAEKEENWKKSPFLMSLTGAERNAFFIQFFNYFRSSFALHHHALEKEELEIATNKMQESLKSDWLYKEEEYFREPIWMRLEKSKSKRYRSQSISSGSSLGRYLKKVAKEKGQIITSSEFDEVMKTILHLLCESGYLEKSIGHDKVSLYRLKAETIEWKEGDGKTLVPDYVRNRSISEYAVKANTYFRKLYHTDPERIKDMVSRDHTGQVRVNDRKEIEEQFRNAAIQVMFCSPTMELGIDIADLAVVHMRNVPPNPANYAQRSGRAGRKGQGALILTFCSKKSAHDQHFFRHKMDMITGKVTPQKLDLLNPELLRSHLHAACLSACGINELTISLSDIMEVEHPDIPLKPAIKELLNLKQWQKVKLKNYFDEVLRGLLAELNTKSWFSTTWVEEVIEAFPKQFDEVCQSWREMYKEAVQSKNEATQQLNSRLLAKSNEEWKIANNQLHTAQSKLDQLRNITSNGEISEFYPFRYLASMGLLPGYDFPRLPIRVFLNGKNGTYISRPRLQALKEFGPGNMIYYKGEKWRVDRMIFPNTENKFPIEQGRIEKETGYFSKGKELEKDVQTFSGNPNANIDDFEEFADLLQQSDMEALKSDRISCMEDERRKRRYTDNISFSFQKETTNQVRMKVKYGEEAILSFHYLPAAHLHHLIRKGTKSEEIEGFLLDEHTGRWKKKKDVKEQEKSDDPVTIKTVKLYTTIRTDCIYIEPLRNLHLDHAGTITLMYALKKAIEIYFQIDEQELGCELMGDPKAPNILFYESAEGSLGVLSRLVEEKGCFAAIIEKAKECSGLTLENQGEVKAGYDNLLSYYNQRYHRDINPEQIREALEILSHSSTETDAGATAERRDLKYKALQKQLTTKENVAVHKELLEEFHSQKMRLPDQLFFREPETELEFDFYFEPDYYVLLNDRAPGREEKRQRERLKRNGGAIIEKDPDQDITAFATQIANVLKH